MPSGLAVRGPCWPPAGFSHPCGRGTLSSLVPLYACFMHKVSIIICHYCNMAQRDVCAPPHNQQHSLYDQFKWGRRLVPSHCRILASGQKKNV